VVATSFPSLRVRWKPYLHFDFKRRLRRTGVYNTERPGGPKHIAGVMATEGWRLSGVGRQEASQQTGLMRRILIFFVWASTTFLFRIEELEIDLRFAKQHKSSPAYSGLRNTWCLLCYNVVTAPLFFVFTVTSRRFGHQPRLALVSVA
jgi:hypothetical protein